MHPKIFKDESGFTLLELVTVLIVFGIISVVIVNLMSRQAETFTKVFNNSDLVSNGRKAIDQLRRDLHGVSAGNITTMTSSNLIFTDINGASINYSYSSSNLSRNDVTLAEHVTNNPFSYLDASQNVIYSNADLIFIKINLQLGKLTESVQLEELIYLRN